MGAAVRRSSSCSVERWQGEGARAEKRGESGRMRSRGTAACFKCIQREKASVCVLHSTGLGGARRWARVCIGNGARAGMCQGGQIDRFDRCEAAGDGQYTGGGDTGQVDRGQAVQGCAQACAGGGVVGNGATTTSAGRGQGAAGLRAVSRRGGKEGRGAGLLPIRLPATNGSFQCAQQRAQQRVPNKPVR